MCSGPLSSLPWYACYLGTCVWIIFPSGIHLLGIKYCIFHSTIFFSTLTCEKTATWEDLRLTMTCAGIVAYGRGNCVQWKMLFLLLETHPVGAIQLRSFHLLKRYIVALKNRWIRLWHLFSSLGRETLPQPHSWTSPDSFPPSCSGLTALTLPRCFRWGRVCITPGCKQCSQLLKLYNFQPWRKRIFLALIVQHYIILCLIYLPA